MKEETGETKSQIQVVHLEDDSNDAELIRTSLANHNIPCSIAQAQTAKEFEAALQKGGIDLILSDSRLPGFDTLLALTQARQRYPEVPFIFVSGAVSPRTKADAFMRGATDFISKDDLPKLARVIHWLFFLNQHKHRRMRLPKINAPVMAQCKGFRCLAYFDSEGKWRDFGTSAELSGVIDWFAPDGSQ